MNDHLPDDELASAYLDGETDADERARVESSPRLLGRVAELQSVSERLAGEQPILTDADRQRLLAAALAAADREATGEDDRTIARPLTALAAERRRTRGRPRWLPPPAIAAAVLVILMVTGIALIATGRGRGDGRGDLRAAGRAGGAGSTERSAGGPPTTPAGRQQNAPPSNVPELPDLGRFGGRQELTRALASVEPGTLARRNAPGSTTTPEGSGTAQLPRAITRCDQVLRSSPGRALGPALAAASATLSGRPVLILSNPVQGSRPPKTQLSVVDPTSCVVQFAIER
ncbi:MAG: zf-HC2 domain-containing protein [Actinobacteria bacterium]|nr:zf-HC2 domain-containing protein [Actinomycetota bacterium]